MKDEWQLLMIIKRVCKCDIDLIQQLIKQEVNIKVTYIVWLQHYGLILLYFVNENSFR